MSQDKERLVTFYKRRRNSHLNINLNGIPQQTQYQHLFTMKVIVTGTTGLVGSIVLRECIKNSLITSIIAFSRCPLLEELSDNEKVTVITHEDFSQYSDELLKELSGAEACLW